MFLWKYIFIITTGSLLCGINSENILAVFPSHSRANYEFGKIILMELINRGHSVTLISNFKMREKQMNLTEIKIIGVPEHLVYLGLLDDSYIQTGERSIIENLINLIYGSTAIADYTLGYPEVQDLFKLKNPFDLLILDMYFADSFLGLAHYWKIPSIILSSTGTHKWTNEMVGNPHSPAYNPLMVFPYTDRMNLPQRFINFLASTFEKITYNYLYLPSQEAVYKRYFEPLMVSDNKSKQQSLPPLIDLIHNVSLVLLNSHSAIQYARSYPANMIQIGGVHITKQNSSLLSQSILDYIDAVPDGVIYMNFGTMIKTTDLPNDKLQIFFNVFKSYVGKIRVIMKWENATLDDQPSNMVIGPWLPQQQILDHPKVKLFITTGGIFSIMEAISSKTPILGIPIYGDQEFNIANVVSKGIGRKLNYQSLTEDSLKQLIDEIWNNTIYQENIEKLQLLFTDNAIKPIDNVIYNIEYVMRTKGAHHLRSAALDLTFFSQNLLDVLLIIILIIIIIIGVPSTIICIVLRKINNSSNAGKMPPKINLRKKKKQN